MIPVCSATLLAVMLAVAQIARADAAGEGIKTPVVDLRIANAWRTLRAVDCARCHGADYGGMAAPSIISYARTQSREMFVRIVLDGDPPRGMPGYRDNPRIAENIDDVYQYFLGRANETFDSGSRPQSP